MAHRSISSSNSMQPHAIALPAPEQGHINGMFHLCYELASKGLVITFVTLEFFRKRIIDQTSAALHNASLDFRFVGLCDNLPVDLPFSGAPTPPIWAAHLNARDDFEALVMKLRTQQPPLTCFLSDLTVGWAQEIANTTQIPRVCFSAISASSYALYTHVPEIISCGFHPFEHTVKYGSKSREQVTPVSAIVALPPLHPADLCFRNSGSDTTWISNWTSAIRLQQPEAAWIFCNTFHEIEGQIIDSLHRNTSGKFLALGPLVPSILFDARNSSPRQNGASLLDAEDHCLIWLDTQAASSVLYNSFGSLVELSDRQVEEIYLGLLASEQPFLLVIRSKSQREMLQTITQDSKRGRVIGWAPQAEVLRHTAVGGFLTHCGWNSVLESIAAGIPILGWPFDWDQLTNCWFIVNKWKIGIEIEWEEDRLVEGGEVERAVRRLMQTEESKEIMQRAMLLKNAALEARNGSSQRAMDEFVKDMQERAARSCD